MRYRKRGVARVRGGSVGRRWVTDDERESWGRTRERGLFRYLVVTGLAKAGVVFWTVFSTLDYLTRYGLGSIEPFPLGAIRHFAAWIPGSVAVGLIFAIFRWLIVNQRYKNAA